VSEKSTFLFVLFFKKLIFYTVSIVKVERFLGP